MKKSSVAFLSVLPAPVSLHFLFFFSHSTQPCASVSHVLRKTIVVTVFFPVFLDTVLFAHLGGASTPESLLYYFFFTLSFVVM